MSKKVLLTGGPGTGKTTLINLLKEHNYFCLPEVSREIISEAQKKGITDIFKTDPLYFSEQLLEKRTQQYHIASENQHDFCFIDRGIHDIVAYLDYSKTPYPNDYTKAIEELTYDLVFVFPTWKEIYTTDQERMESFEECELVHQHIVGTYKKYHPNCIEVPKVSPKERLQFYFENFGIN